MCLHPSAGVCARAVVGAAAPLRAPAAPLGGDVTLGRGAARRGQRDEQGGAETGPPRPASLPSEFKLTTAENTGLPSGLQKQG